MNGTLSLILATIVLSADPPPTTENATGGSTAQERLAVMRDAAARYDFRADGGTDRAVLHPELLLRWSNPVAEEDDAGLILWTRQGRPEVAAQFFVRRDIWMHEFQSLSESPFTVDWDSRPVWSPRQAGLVFRAELRAAPPEKSPVRRLQQMRAIAESFTAAVEFQYAKESHYELRLLPRPLFRYESAGAKVLDGTLWAFVQGTNPEVLLLVESRAARDSTPGWCYAFAAMTSYPAEARRNGKPVWKVDRQPIPTPTTTGVYLFRNDVPALGPE